MPLGYKKVEDNPVAQIEPHDAEAVRLAFALYGTGRYTLEQVAKALNEKGYRSRTRQGRRPFSKGMLDSLLENHWYIGEVKYGRWTTRWDEKVKRNRRVWTGNDYYQGKHEPLISRELFEYCQTFRRKLPHGYQQPRQKGDYLCSGLLICSECGSLLHGHPSLSRDGKNHYYYRPSCHIHFPHCSASQKFLKTTILDEQVGQIIGRLLLPLDWQEAIIEMTGRRNEVEEIQKEKNKINEKLKRIGRLYYDEILSDHEYSLQRQQLLDRLRGLRLPSEEEVVTAGKYLEKMVDYWRVASSEERREILIHIVESMKVTNNRIIAVKPRHSFLLLFKQCEGLIEETDFFVVVSESEAQT